MSDKKWHDARECGIEGKGWTETLRFYDRLPKHAERTVPPEVWGHSRSATGMSIRFRTDAPAIFARWELRSSQLGEPNFPVAGFSGLDLYGDDCGKWRWVAATQNLADQHPEVCMIEGLDGQERAYCLYLPLRNPVEKLEIGVPADATFTAIPPRAEPPLVFYGTSIVHGAYASHAGMVHTSILGRRLHQPVINLGFSGVAKMELALADLLGELEAAIYVIDALPNMDQALVYDRVDPFVRRLRKLRPATPIVLVEDRPLTNSWIRPQIQFSHDQKWKAYRMIYEDLAPSIGNLHYVKGRSLFGADGEASLDSSHPSDLGFMRQADALEKVLRKLLA